MDSIIVSSYLLWGTWQDIRKRKISHNYLWIGGILGVIVRIISFREGSLGYPEWLWALLPGITFLVMAKITKEKIGLGDGWVLVILANYMNLGELCMLLQTTLIVVVLFALILLCSRRVSKEYPIPFLPFLWISHLILWRLGYV